MDNAGSRLSGLEPDGHATGTDPGADIAADAAADPADAPGHQAIALPVAAVARRLGVAPATLRTWARRYDLGPSEHSAGAHRRYTSADVARLEAMRRLTLEGVPPGEAARAARTVAAARAQDAPEADDRTAAPAAGPARSTRGGPGGRVLALPGSDAVVRGLGRAAMALDSRTVTTMVREQLATRGVVATWDDVLRPVLAAAGARWATTGAGVEVEHLLSDCITAALREVAETAAERPGRRPVLLAGGPQEQHALPMHAVAAGLAERGVASRVLGPAMPVLAIGAAVRRTGAAALFVWSQFRETADASLVSELPVTRPPTALVVGGPGWAAVPLPDRVGVARDLPDALDRVSHAVGA